MRILLADDQANVRFALRVLLERQPSTEVVGEIQNAEDLLKAIQSTQPDLVLIGWELPGVPASHLPQMLRQICPHVRIIALSGRPEARLKALSAGVDAFVSKIEPPDGLLAAISHYTKERKNA